MTWIDASDSPHHTFHSPQVRSRYLRLSLPSLLPSDVDRVIYIDADTLVLSDLSPLFGSDIAGKALLAVRDYRIPFVAAPLGLKNHRDLKISADAPYFNSGVMLMSLEVWRRRDIEKRTLNYCVKMWPSMTLHDQEALNAVLHDEWSELDLGWNQQSVLFRPQAIPESDFKRMCLGRAANLRANPAIVHFTGGSKPWGYRCSHPFRRAWHTAFRNSGWFSDTLEYMRWYGPFLTSDLSRRAWSRARRLSPLSRFSQALSAAKRNT